MFTYACGWAYVFCTCCLYIYVTRTYKPIHRSFHSIQCYKCLKQMGLDTVIYERQKSTRESVEKSSKRRSFKDAGSEVQRKED